ncbi:MAG TPA: hypothetical protein VMY78_16290 [Solirubrobacteraceae bacterium]|nr:hypothetical protein [Solirubrobacteraceae bacterium]
MPRTFIRFAMLVLVVVCCGAAAAPAGAVTATKLSGIAVGVADQKPDMFADPRVSTMGIRYARLAVSWDAMNIPWEVAELDEWLEGAEQSGVEPLISFMHSRTKRSRPLPTPLRLRQELRRFRARYPWVTTFATWNEANHCGERTCRRPTLVAGYYRALRQECPSCTVLAPEMLDMPNMQSWARDFRKALGYSPRIWGLHNYVEANRFKMTRLRQLLKVTVNSQIWLTEVGGLVRRRNNSTTDIPEGVRHAGDVTRFIFDELLPANPRIKRVYLYHWNAGPLSATWDSGLVNRKGGARSALFVLARYMRVNQPVEPVAPTVVPPVAEPPFAPVVPPELAAPPPADDPPPADIPPPAA